MLVAMAEAIRPMAAAGMSWAKQVDTGYELANAMIRPNTVPEKSARPIPVETYADRPPVKMKAPNEIEPHTPMAPTTHPARMLAKSLSVLNSLSTRRIKGASPSAPKMQPNATITRSIHCEAGVRSALRVR